jgi:hypothetical protein
MNLYRRLLEIIPGKPLLVGMVVSQNDNGTSNVQLAGGGIVVARNGADIAINSYAYVRDGVIEGEAPSQFTTTIEI